MIVGSHTSLVPIETHALSGGETILVYISSTSEVGQLVTIRDIHGFLSSPQSITISTIDAAVIQGTVNPIRLDQRYSYITLRSVTNTTWAVADENPLNPSTNSLLGLTANALEACNATVTTLSGNQFTANTLYVDTTLEGTAPLYIQTTLGVGNSTTSTFQVIGNLMNQGSMEIQGIPVVGSNTLLSSTGVVGGISCGAATVAGSIIQSAGQFAVQGNIRTASTATFQSALSTGGVFQASTTSVRGTLQTSRAETNSLAATTVSTKAVQFSTATFMNLRPDISITAPGYIGTSTPVEFQEGLLTTRGFTDWINATTLFTDGIGIATEISSPYLTTFTMSNATIQNSNGSLVISSMDAGAVQSSNLYGLNGSQQIPQVQVLAGQLVTSTLGIQYEMMTGLISLPRSICETVFTHDTTTSSLNLGGNEARLEAMSVRSIAVSSGTNAATLSSMIIPNAAWNNAGGTFTGGNVNASTATLSSISRVYQIAGAATLAFSTPFLTIGQAVASTVSSYTVTTSSMNAVSMTFGEPFTISTGSLYFFASTVSGLTSNTPYEYISGLGTTYSPIVINASVDRTVNLYPINISSFSTSYINAQMTFRTDASINNGIAGLRVVNSNAFSTLISFSTNSAIPFQSFQLSNYPVDRNFDTVPLTYYFSGAATSYPISTISNQVLIAAGNTLAYSYDRGITWTITTDGTLFDTGATAVAWNGSMWIATGIGSVNTLAYSYDGISWYGLGKASFTLYANTVAWNGTLWVAGGAGANTFAYSYNGITWTGLGATVIGTETSAIAWNGYMFVAVGRDNNTLAYSYDGITWIGGGNTIFSYGHGIAWGSSTWVAVGEGTGSIAYSYDGFNWNFAASPIFTTKGSCIAWNGSIWLAGGAGTNEVAYSSDGIAWTGVSLSAYLTNATGVAWTGTNWVLLGSNGAILTSGNGITWVPVTSPLITGRGLGTRASTEANAEVLYTTTNTTSLAYSAGGKRWYNVTSLISGTVNSILWNGRVWLAATQGTDTILYSRNGVEWIGLGQIIFTSAFQIAWNGYIWVATGSGTNTLAYSYDGLAWTGLGAAVFTAGYGVAWGRDRFVATGEGSTTTAYSYDGLTWTPVAQSFFTSGRKLAYNGTQWVAGGQGSSPLIYSSDGANWLAATTQPFNTVAWDVAWSGSLWVAVGTATTGVNAAWSADGIVWNPLTLGISGRGVAWNGTKWLVTGGAAPNPIVYSSSDGVNWVSENPDRTGPAYTIVSKQPSIPYEYLTIACASSATALMAVSPDGRFWTPISSPFTQHARGVAWNGTLWVAGGGGTYQIAYSSDGISWTGVVLPNVSQIYAVAWSASATTGVGKWIAVGEGANTWADSSDGIQWTARTPSPTSFFTTGGYAIIAAQTGWIALGGTNMGGLVRSTNGTSWTAASPVVFTTGRGIAWNGRDFVAVGQGTNTLAFSTNATDWVGFPVFSVQGNGVAYGAGTWVAVGEGTDTIAYSVNGFEWVGLGAGVFSQRGNGVTWNGAYFTAVGQGTNTLAYSDDGIHWTAHATTFSTATYLGNPGAGNGVGARQHMRTPLVIREGETFTWESAGWAAPVSPSIVMKSPSGTAAWDSRVNSTTSLTDTVYVIFRPTSTACAFMMGVSEAPTTTTNYSQINYAISCSDTGALSIYELGVFVNSYGTYGVGDTFKITFELGRIRYYQNDTLMRLISRTSTAPLFLSASINTPGTKLVDIEFHSIYRISTTVPSFSTTSYVASVLPGLGASLAPPFYLNLTGDLNPSQWNLQFTAGASGLIRNYSTALFADIYVNDTKYFTTNVVNAYLNSTPQTYQLNFSVATTISYVANTALNVRFRADRSVGDVYTYVNWINSNGIPYSTVMNNLQVNPNAMEYLEFFHVTSNTGLQTSELSAWISPVSTTQSYLDTSATIDMNFSYMKWDTGLNAVTIQNRFNDIQTRSLTYTGALYNASDSNLKHSIEYADTNRLAGAFDNIRLRRFAFSAAYCSTFQVEDRVQLGVLTSEVMPSIVTEVPFEHCGLSTLNTVDRTQLRYLHLAATQALMCRVSSLRAALQVST